MARKKVEKVKGRKPLTRRTLTLPTQKRIAAMNACSPVVTQLEICHRLDEDGVELSRALVGFALNGRLFNAEVARVFCELTATKLADMWPEFVDANGKEREKETAENDRWAKAAREGRASGGIPTRRVR